MQRYIVYSNLIADYVKLVNSQGLNTPSGHGDFQNPGNWCSHSLGTKIIMFSYDQIICWWKRYFCNNKKKKLRIKLTSWMTRYPVKRIYDALTTGPKIAPIIEFGTIEPMRRLRDCDDFKKWMRKIYRRDVYINNCFVLSWMKTYVRRVVRDKHN